MFEIAIVCALRTPIGRFGGSLCSLPAASLGARVIKGLIEKTGIDRSMINEVIMGQVLTAGQGQNPARQTAIYADLPVTCPAVTINKVCGSGLKAVIFGVQAIQNDCDTVIIAGGQENMSRSGHLFPRSHKGETFTENHLTVDTLLFDGLTDAFSSAHMGVTAENIAKNFAITRLEQDKYAFDSYTKAIKAKGTGKFRNEIVSCLISGSEDVANYFAEDEYIKSECSLITLGKLDTIFCSDGTVTSGNSSGINDGAAAVLLMSLEKAKQLGLDVLGIVRGYASVGVDPQIMGTGPILATKKCLEYSGWDISQLDLIELNEAFASQAILVNRELGWDTRKVNVNGGSIALGHPIGASGCRILVTLLHEMVKKDLKKGLVTLCIGGGQGIALAVER